MRPRSRSLIPALGLALAACHGPATLSTEQLSGQLALADDHGLRVDQGRLVIDGDRVIGGAVPLTAAELPPVVSRQFEALAPDGEVVFLGREWGPNGAGFRLEKHYREPDHLRSLLVAEHGELLERAQTVPVSRVPGPVLTAALTVAPFVDEARLVESVAEPIPGGPHWTLLVRDRIGAQSVLTLDLDGRLLGRRRRIAAQVDA